MLVLLLRLRQICNHPALISGRGEDLEAAGRTRAEAEVERAIKSFGAGFASKVRAKIRDLETERMEAELAVRELDSSSSVDILKKVRQQSGDDGQDGQVEECPICFDVLSDGVVTGCCHVFCRECISESCSVSIYLRNRSNFLPQPAGILNSPPTNNAQNMNEDERPCELHLFCDHYKHTYRLSRSELPSTHLLIQAVYPRGFQLPDLIEEGEAEGFSPAL